MSFISWVPKLIRMGSREREAFLTVLLTEVAVRGVLSRVSLGRARRLLAAGSRPRTKPALLLREQAVELLRGAVERAGWVLRKRSTCLTRAVAGQYLLARWGYRARVHIGVTRGSSQVLAAHAWLEMDGEVLLGDTGDLQDFRLLAIIEAGEVRRGPQSA